MLINYMSITSDFSNINSSLHEHHAAITLCYTL